MVSRMPKLWTVHPDINRARPAGDGRSPRILALRARATATSGLSHPAVVRQTGPLIARMVDAVSLLGLMTKAKRRKLRARRKKANHGRRPNAGRG